MAARGKEGKTEIQKSEYLENEKSFLDEIKNIFRFLKGYHLLRNKILLKIVDTSFRVVWYILSFYMSNDFMVTFNSVFGRTER